MTDDADTLPRDERAFRMRLLGLPVRTIAQQLGCTPADVARAIEERLPRIDNAFRMSTFSLDLARLDQLTSKCLEAISHGSLGVGGSLLLKCLERRAQMLGLDAPIRIDPVELVEATRPESSTENLRRIFTEMRAEQSAEPQQPNPPKLPH
jgi:hypothetical protein